MDYSPVLLLFTFSLTSVHAWPSRLLPRQCQVPSKSLCPLEPPYFLAQKLQAQSLFPAPVPESATSPKTLGFRTLSNYILETSLWRQLWETGGARAWRQTGQQGACHNSETVEARTQVAATAERRGPPETWEDETTGLGVNTTLKGEGGGLPEDSPGPPGEPGGTAAITGMKDRLPGGRGSRAAPGLGWPCGRPPDGHMGPRREEMRPSWAEDRPRAQPVPHRTGDRQGGPGKETGETRGVQSAMDQER